MGYKYHLLKYRGKASRLTCPNCGRKNCFAPYVDANDQIVGEQYGRCNHESSCGYVKYPPSEREWRESRSEYQSRRKRPEKHIISRPEPKPEPPGGICTIPQEIVSKTIRTKPLSDFLKFLLTMFDMDTVVALVKEYYLGVTKAGDVIFYQIDSQGRCRTGKVMKYNPETGHRIKDPTAKTPITWVHSLLKQQGVLPHEWKLTQCLFGEHLLKKYPDKPVCLVEAEKTAIIAAALVPECIWVAVGGKTQLGDKVEVLQGRTVIAFPDVDGYDKWVKKCAERTYLNIHVSDYLQNNATEEDRQMGADIADLLIRWRQAGRTSGNSADTTTGTADDPSGNAPNPVFLQIQKYISPEHHDNVLALIEELELEVVGVGRRTAPPDDLRKYRKK